MSHVLRQGAAAFVLLLAGWATAAHGQHLQLSYNDESGTDCPLKFEDIKPVIDRFNPFFTQHTWDDNNKREVAYLADGREVIVEQRGCNRLHTVVQLTVPPDVADNQDLSAYAIEMFNLFNRLFYQQTEYFFIKAEFEKVFIEKFGAAGLDNLFDFPLADRNFLCLLGPSDEGGMLIQVELIKYVHAQQIKLPGIEDYLDDGYYKPPMPVKKP